MVRTSPHVLIHSGGPEFYIAKNVAKPTGCPGAGRCGGIEDVICAIGGGASTMISGTSSTTPDMIFS